MTTLQLPCAFQFVCSKNNLTKELLAALFEYIIRKIISPYHGYKLLECQQCLCPLEAWMVLKEQHFYTTYQLTFLRTSSTLLRGTMARGTNF